MKIWYFHNYTMLPEHGTLNRGYYLGKYWKRMGHEPIIFAGSHPHNTDIQLINDRTSYKIYQDTPFPWVLIRTKKYCKNRIQQVVSMFEYYINAKRAASHFDRPDVIIGSSAHPLAAILAIKLAKKLKCEAIVEIRDLWPESIVEYGILRKRNPIVIFLYKLEKYIYTKTDRLMFLFEGGYSYIEEKGWTKEIPKGKVFFSSNGTDIEEFKANAEKYIYEDKDLEDKSLFKVVYTGAVKHANKVGIILEIAKKITNPRVVFFIWGDGNEYNIIKQRIIDERITNVSLKGRVEKKYIPSILIRSNLGIVDVGEVALMRFGYSPNKLYDYFAAGLPVLVEDHVNYNPVIRMRAGIEADMRDTKKMAEQIEDLANINNLVYEEFKKNSQRASVDYSYEEIARRIICDIHLNKNTAGKVKNT